MSDSIRFYEFGEFRLDARKRLLLKSGEQTQISPRIFDLLLVLVQNEGEILSHDDLLDKVWDGMFVEQSNLKKSISALRQILGEHADERLFVKTVPRRGYSFVAPVRELDGDADLEAVYLRETHTEIVVEEIEEDDASDETAAEALGQMPAAKIAGSETKLRRGGLVIGVGAVVLVALAAAGYYLLRSKNDSKFAFDNVKISKLTSIGDAEGAVISPDGKYIVYVSKHPNGATIMLQQVSTGQSTILTPPTKASFYFYSFTADSEYVEYSVDNNQDTSQNGYFRIALLGGPPTRLSSLPRAISPDSSREMFIRMKDGESQLVIANIDGSEEHILESFSTDYRIWSTKWSPDGTSVLLALRKLVPGNILHFVVEYPINGGPKQIIVPEMEKQITSAVWLPDKTRLLLCLREVNSEVRQIWQYTPATGQFVRVTNDNSSYAFLSISNDGRFLVTSAHDGISNISIAETAKLDFHQVRVGASNEDRVAWTADGRLMFDAVINKVESIYMVNADGSNQRQITKGDDGLWLVPRVSSDGRSILFASTRTGRKQLWHVDLEGRNLSYMTNFDDLQAINGKLLSDNQSVIFEGYNKESAGALYLKHPDGTISKLTETEVDFWDISPDESMIAYAARDPSSHKDRIFIRRIDKGDILQAFDVLISRELHWTRDNKAVSYIVTASEQSEIYQQPLSGGPPKLVARFPGERAYSFDWSMDGSKLAVAKGRDQSDAVMITNQEGKQ